jgi:hypothetical protein
MKDAPFLNVTSFGEFPVHDMKAYGGKAGGRKV